MPAPDRYEELRAAHRWDVPARYNIAADVCDKHDPDKLAMIWERFDGERRDLKWGELQELANRAAFMRKLGELFPKGAVESTPIAIHYLDLDHFKEVNDALGHDVGDALLKEVAYRLRGALREGEHVSRIGGDEFVVIQEHVEGREEAAALADRLLAAFRRPYLIKGHSLRVTPSIGIALSSESGSAPEALVKSADQALYSVKAGGRGDYRFHDPALDGQLQRRREIGTLVRSACDDGGFELCFQPVYSLLTGELAGFEALIRLPRGDGSYVSPAEFIPVAEDLGLIRQIGAWVVKTACRAAVGWPGTLSVAVNLSPTEFRESGLVAMVAKAIEESGLSPGCLEVEVTEGVFLTDTGMTRETLKGLKQLGVSIVLDDFGTGYSSLSYLWQFPFDKIKIDQSFVRAIGVSDNIPAIIRTIIAMGRALDLRVTAEGVETEAQAELLRSMRCDLVQGYLYGRPMAGAEVRDLIANLPASRPGLESRRALSA